MDINSKIFVIHIAIEEQEDMPMHFKRQAQVGALLFDKAFTEDSVECSDYNHIFSVEYTAKLLENTKINEHVIKLEEDKQLSCRPIYNLRPVELETLKIYIKINLVNGFIWFSKSPARALILFNKKPNKSLRFVWIIEVLTISPLKTNIRYL